MNARFAAAMGASVLSLALPLVNGCSGTRPLTRADVPVIASNEEFAVVRMPGERSVEELARLFLDDSSEAWQIEEVNASTRQQSGRLLAIPLRPVNVTGVYDDHFRTVPILCYHQFVQGRTPAHRLELRARDFEAQLRYLRSEGYRFLSFAEVNEIIRQRRPVPEKSVVLTIDDGYRSVYEVAWPLLRKYNAKATLFIYTDFIGGGDALSWSQLREMDASELIEIESHGKSHTSLARTEADTDAQSYQRRLEQELAGSEAAFIANLGRPPRFLSYPYGNSSREIAGLLERSGYDLAATVTRGNNGSFADPHLLHRTMIYEDHTVDDLKKLLATKRSL